MTKPKQRFSSDLVIVRRTRRKRNGGKTPQRADADVDAWVGDDACGVSVEWDVEVGVTVKLKDLGSL